MSERTDAEESVDEVLISINAVSNVIGTTDLRRPQVEEILKKIPMEMMDRIKVLKNLDSRIKHFSPE